MELDFLLLQPGTRVLASVQFDAVGAATPSYALRCLSRLGMILLAFVANWTAGAASLRGDISIDDYANVTNDRFTNSDSFILHGFDLSGIGQNSGGRWATAISRNVVISAAHAPSSGTIFFYPDNDPSSVPVTRNVLSGSGTRVGFTDLYLAVLDFNLPDSISHYAFATEPLIGVSAGVIPPLPVDNAGIYQDMNAYMFGISPATQLPQQDQAVGRNRITGYSENTPFLGNSDNDSLIFEKDAPGDADYVEHEARFVGGDSGGPTFVEINGELRLIGTNAFIYSGSMGIDDFVTGGIGSGINYTGNQAAFINEFIALNAVPEPSSVVLLGMGVGGLLLRRRRDIPGILVDT